MAQTYRIDGLTGPEWLEQLFEYEYCDECGKDAEDHQAVPFMGGWFACCLKPEEEEKPTVRKCKFCEGVRAFVWAYAFPITGASMVGLAVALYWVIML